MPHTLRLTAIALASALSLGVIACNRGDKAGGSGKPGASQSASVPKVQTNRAPCDWISRADAEKALGEPLIGDPVRVRTADNTVPQADGDACLYEMKSNSEITKRVVGIELALDDAGAMQMGFSGVPDLKAAFKDKESKGDSLVDGKWDYVSGVPGGLTMARQGRITVQIFAWGEMEKGMALASAIVDQIPDLPPLKMPPYRSRESSSLAHGNGSSCSYFTGKHRVLVVTPTYSGGAMQFKMMSGVGNLMSSVIGGAKAPDTLEGKWDQITTSPTGALVFLKGDQMVEMQFKSSPTDYNGAAKLAQAAATRL